MADKTIELTSAQALSLTLNRPPSLPVLSTKFNIELRNSDGELKHYLTPWVSDVQWEWKRKGGCGSCRISIALPYRDIEFDALDDIQIRVVDGSTTKLVYRGWVSRVEPSLGADAETITLDVKGYFELLNKIVIQDSGSAKNFASKKVYEVIQGIMDDFVIGNTAIKYGAIYQDDFDIDTIDFKIDVISALETLATLLGDVEYGVNENLFFYWQQESSSTTHKFIVGKHLKNFRRIKDYGNLVNKIYFEGGDDGGSPYKKTATSSGSISSYFLAEKVVVNSAITSDTCADAYLTAMLNDNDSPQYKMSFSIPNTSLRFEDVVPLGKVSIFDDDYDARHATRNVWGTVSPSGGSGKLWGTVDNSGDGVIWGGGSGVYQQQIHTIIYQLSDTPGKFNITVSTGTTPNNLATQLKQTQVLTENLRQRG